MHSAQYTELAKAHREMKELIQDAVMLLRPVDKSNWGVTNKQTFAKLENKAFGTPYNEKDWCMDDLNGEQ